MKIMRKLNVWMAAILFSLLSVLANAQHAYFQKYQPVADSLESVYGIPSAVILAVAFHESGAGKSQVATLLNNHFGIKGSNNLMETHKIQSKYKYYPSVNESYNGFCRLVSSKKYYAGLKSANTKDCKKWVESIASAGYAGNAERWTNSIMGVIQKYKLN
jgi:Bax protein